MGDPLAPAVTRVAVVDDHPVFRAGLRGVVERMPDAEIVGDHATGDAFLDSVDDDSLDDGAVPDVVVLDLHMPGTDGVDVTRALQQRRPDCRVVVLTMLEDDGTVHAALAAGARGYLVKGSDEAEIASAIRIAAAGGTVLGPAAARTALTGRRAPAPDPSQPFPQLSDRESQVLELVARGRANRAIAAELHLTHQTVRNYVSSIFLKLGVAGRGEAIVLARETGMGVSSCDAPDA